MPSPVGDIPVPGGTPRFLSELKAGESARVIGIHGDDDLRRRLLEMGLTTGSTVRVVRFAPMGDPIELAVRGYRLSVRRDEARAVAVETLDRSPSSGGQ
jgi:Fe2+ transport system protein FeoA